VPGCVGRVCGCGCGWVGGGGGGGGGPRGGGGWGARKNPNRGKTLSGGRRRRCRQGVRWWWQLSSNTGSHSSGLSMCLLEACHALPVSPPRGRVVGCGVGVTLVRGVVCQPVPQRTLCSEAPFSGQMVRAEASRAGAPHIWHSAQQPVQGGTSTHHSHAIDTCSGVLFVSIQICAVGEHTDPCL
jgi:hypothetical protein